MEHSDDAKTALQEEDRAARISDTLPVLHVRDQVIYPEMKIPLFVGRERSLRALEEAAAHDRHIMLVAQRSLDMDAPTPDDLYQVGTVGRTMEPLRLPDGTLRVVVEGMARARIVEYLQSDPFYRVRVEVLPERAESCPEAEALIRDVLGRFERAVKRAKGVPREDLESVRSPMRDVLGRLDQAVEQAEGVPPEALDSVRDLMHDALGRLEQAVKRAEGIPPEALDSVRKIEKPGELADAVACFLTIDVAAKQEILETIDPKARLERILPHLRRESEAR